MTGETQTYELVLQRTIRTAIAMRSLGIQPNDIITVCSHNILDCQIPFYASFFIGAISANLDPLLSSSDTVALLKLVCPKMIFVVPDAVELIENALRETGIDAKIIVFGPTSKHTNYSEFLKPSPEENNFVPYEVKNLKETAVIVFSSGTTGLPKGICLSHYSLLGQLYLSGTENIPPPGLTVFTFSNLYWIAAVLFSIGAIAFGWNILIYPRFKEGRSIWNVLKTYKVNILSANPHQALKICRDGRPADADISALLLVLLPGGPLTTEQILHIRECFDFPNTLVFNTYGQTEMNTHTLRFDVLRNPNNMKFLIEKPQSVGRPIPGYSYKIVDLKTEEILGPNQEGELLIKSPFMMNGYYKQDSSMVWDADGFMRTGDIAYYDDDECFFIVDRVKELLKYQMWHISPVKLEAILYTHAAVQACVVSSIPHPVDGDHLVGIVVLKESEVGNVTEKELQEYVDGKVAEHQKLRGGVKFVKSIPLTVTEKTGRMKIKQLLTIGKL
ncbi:hypothetical protein ILUMI_19056 [Ignelater luminosus]|uniref:Luciferin 4-monooxygenase n=1 Tax=Ignelater luminosus TaxID=2038154 RepID=A0A8K0CKW9_IGNLU|nr:hypothetical protein ILUMI_19056 [Ignelater luminosus]